MSGTLLRIKLSLSQDTDVPPDARCGAMCSQCLSYQKGHCPSCPQGNEKTRSSCQLFQCASKKDTVCTECPDILHCAVYRTYSHQCPFITPVVMRDSLPEGQGFLVKERVLEESLNLFTDRIIRGDFGLIVMRQSPEVLSGILPLRRIPVVQLNQTTTEDSNLDPTNLARLHLTIQEFFEAAPRATVLLEGMEYLIVHNGIDRMLRFVHSIIEFVKIYKSRFITLVDPRVLEDEELALLERELVSVSP
ncbi:MAG: DUF835 domain-containing protein [Theionarchaea archaeon]|nr:DUF835 domain-containing protein [Theionarchaea archaeon]MBU7037098.1 DUF835 domain-containing protein [Theionarchaea archaeon]